MTQGGIAYADDGGVLIEHIAGDISNNVGVSNLVGGGNIKVVDIEGGIFDNEVIADSTGLFYAMDGSGIFLDRIHGSIERNHVFKQDKTGGSALFYAEDGGVVLNNIDGHIQGNTAPHGVIYAYGDVSIRNVQNIRNNHGSSYYGGVVYTEDGSVLVNNVKAIQGNSNLQGGSIFHAYDDLYVFNVDGDVSDNHCGQFEDSAVFYSYEQNIEVKNVTGAIHHNTGYQGVAYASNGVRISSIGGSLTENVGAYCIIGADGGTLSVSDINGDISHNTLTSDGGIFYGETDAGSERLSVYNIHGSIFGNIGLEDSNALFYGYSTGVSVHDIDGDVYDNEFGYALFYADDSGLSINNIGDIRNNVLKNFGAIAYSDYDTLITNIGDIRDNLLAGDTALAYADYALVVNNFGSIPESVLA
jgi:hypothetical protein